MGGDVREGGQKLALKRRTFSVDADLMAGRGWLIAGATLLAGAVLLGLLVHPFVGSGRRCEGIGFGCTPERETDTLLIVAVYAAASLGTLLVAWWRARHGSPWRTVVPAGIVLVILATAWAVWSQLPRHPISPGSLGAARNRWERVLADGRAAAPRDSPLGVALRSLERRGPVPCRDAYGRATGAREFHWSTRDESNAYAGSADSSGAVTAAALGRWADRLRGRGVDVEVFDPSGDPTRDRRLRVGRFGAEADGVLVVRASFYVAELAITVTTGCHRD